jgi:hypothetical protein
MKKNKINLILAILTIVSIFSFAALCNQDRKVTDEKIDMEETEEEDLAEDKMPEISEEETEKVDSRSVNIEYHIAFGIDYANPKEYLVQGEQSQISNPKALEPLYSDEKNLDHLGYIYYWLKNKFTTYPAGGRTIGVVTVDQLLEDRRLGGCHDHGLVYAAIVRELGYPAIMVRSASIAWINKFQADEKEAELHIGHVFVEVYLDDKWVLIDPTNGIYVEDNYNPAKAVIPLKGHSTGLTEEMYGFYVEHKGIDIWASGIHSQADSTESMDKLARQINLENIEYPDYIFQSFPKDLYH